MRTLFFSAIVLASGCSSTLAPVGPSPVFAEEEPPSLPANDPVETPAEAPTAPPPVEEPAPEEEPPAPEEEPPAPEEEPPAPVEEPEPAPQPPAPQPLDCGPNAFEVAGSCECDTLYTTCDATDVSMGCCAYGIDTFEVTLVSAEVIPFKDNGSQSPWDWSGFVPGWMQDIIAEAAVLAHEDAADYVDVLDYVYDFAPELLDGYAPPDTFVDVELAGTEIYESAIHSDLIEPSWDETITVTIGAAEDLTLIYRDSDFGPDDTIAEVPLGQVDLQWLAGLGPIDIQGVDSLHSFTLEVVPVVAP